VVNEWNKNSVEAIQAQNWNVFLKERKKERKKTFENRCVVLIMTFIVALLFWSLTVKRNVIVVKSINCGCLVETTWMSCYSFRKPSPYQVSTHLWRLKWSSTFCCNVLSERWWISRSTAEEAAEFLRTTRDSPAMHIGCAVDASAESRPCIFSSGTELEKVVLSDGKPWF